MVRTRNPITFRIEEDPTGTVIAGPGLRTPVIIAGGAALLMVGDPLTGSTELSDHYVAAALTC